MLSILVVGCYIVMELLELVRHSYLQKVALRLDEAFRQRLFTIAFEANLKRVPGGTIQAFNDLRTLREFIPSGAVVALLDWPHKSEPSITLNCLLPKPSRIALKWVSKPPFVQTLLLPTG